MSLSALARQFLKDILTGKDGVSYDVGRALGFMAGLTYLVIGIHYEARLHAEDAFPFQDFGVGFGALATGIGMLLKLKESSEPNGPAAR